MPRQRYTNFTNIAQEKCRANVKQKDKILRNNNRSLQINPDISMSHTS